MTKPRGPEDFSSSNCQVPVCCRALCSLSHPIYIYYFFFCWCFFFLFVLNFELLNSWRLRLEAGQEGTHWEETPAKPPRSPTAGQGWRGGSC